MVDFPEPPPYAGLFRLERGRLLEVLETLDPSDWERPTPCPGWTVLGLAAHLVGDDLSFLAWQRDGHRGTPAPEGLDEPGFVRWLDQLQAEWVTAARRLSPELVVQLLGWLDDEVATTVRTPDRSSVTAKVSWASADLVPVWLDHARELSERWIHRQQILEALGRPSDLRADLAEPVLDGLRWAFPHRLDAVRRPPGACALVAVTGPEVERRWGLVSDGDRWRFGESGAGPRVAALRLTTDQAWRLLTNNYDADRHGALDVSSDDEIGRTLLRTRAIIGLPKEVPPDVSSRSPSPPPSAARRSSTTARGPRG